MSPAAPATRLGWRTRLADAGVALSVGLFAGLLAHRLAGEEPLLAEEEYFGHLFAEVLIVLLASVIVYWLLEDWRTGRHAERD